MRRHLLRHVAPLRRIRPLWRVATRIYLAARRVRSLALTPWFRLRPPSISDQELRSALGGLTPLEALAGPARGALPTVARFERDLDGLAAPDREHLLAVADGVLAHRFDLLGSGPRDLGERIQWHEDFKTGRRWPLRHVSGITVSYPDHSDIKVPWELSRFQHLPVLAAAYRLTDDERYLREIGAQLLDWIERNPVELGPNWACTMDVAIRAANWVAALVLCREGAAGQTWLDVVLRSLLLHGRFVRRHPEWAPVRGNHYLSDLAGLLVLAALFRGPEGEAWVDWCAPELVREIEHQVNPDGSDHEASIPYHRLVAELFVCGAQAVDALRPGLLDAARRARIDAMLRFAADYARPDGLAPQIGDADDGRFLPLGDYGSADPRRHDHLHRQADRPQPAPAEAAAYPDGGYFVLRRGGLYLLARCGSTGMEGLGGHSHNDQLSFELSYEGEAMVIDPGTYLYTADPAARNLFRSTAYHSTVRLDGAEQNEMWEDLLFAMPDRTRAELLRWAPGRPTVFSGRHHGYCSLPCPAVHQRTITVEEGALVVVEDLVESAGPHDLEWMLPLAPCEVSARGYGFDCRFARATLKVRSDELAWDVLDGWWSPSYGVRHPTRFLRGRRRIAAGRERVRVHLQPEAGG